MNRLFIDPGVRKARKAKAQGEPRKTNLYAHMLIVVAFFVVTFFVFLVITRNPERFAGRHQVENFPSGFPELFKPPRDLVELSRTELLRIIFLDKT